MSFSFSHSPILGRNSVFPESSASGFGGRLSPILGSPPLCESTTLGYVRQYEGSRIASYIGVADVDGATLVSISAMPAYNHKSHEELRWEDYQLGNKGVSSTPSFSLFSPVTFPSSFFTSPDSTRVGDVDGGTVVSVSATPSYNNNSHEELRWEDHQLGDKGVTSIKHSNPFGISGPVWSPAVERKAPTFECTQTFHLQQPVWNATSSTPCSQSSPSHTSSDYGPNTTSNVAFTPCHSLFGPVTSSTVAFTSSPSTFNSTLPGYSPTTSGVPCTSVTTPAPLIEPNSPSTIPHPSTSSVLGSSLATGTNSGFCPAFLGTHSTQMKGSSGDGFATEAASSRSTTNQQLLPQNIMTPDRISIPVTFLSSDGDVPSRARAEVQIIPRGNQIAYVICPMEVSPPKANSEELIARKLTSIHFYEDGKIEMVVSAPVPNSSEYEGEDDKNDTGKGCECIIAQMPKLRNSEYYTEPRIEELAAKEIAEPGFCSRVKDFVVGRHGYGSVKFMGETDVRGLDLNSHIQFNNREVMVSMDDKNPPVGHTLNKAAEVTLLNIKCVDIKTGKQYIDGPKVDKYREMLMKKAEDNGGEHLSYDPVEGVWTFRVQKFSE